MLVEKEWRGKSGFRWVVSGLKGREHRGLRWKILEQSAGSQGSGSRYPLPGQQVSSRDGPGGSSLCLGRDDILPVTTYLGSLVKEKHRSCPGT